MLQNGHVEMKPYPIEDNRFIYILDDGAMVPVALDVLKQQPEFNYAEIDSQKSGPPYLLMWVARANADHESGRPLGTLGYTRT